MAILGLDPSITHLGWVVLDENKTGKDAVLEGGVLKTRPKDGLLVQRLITQRERIRLLISSRKIDFVSMEAPYFSDFSTELLFALNQHLHEAFLDESVFVIYIQPQTLKRHALPDMKMDEITKHHTTIKARSELGMIGRRFSEHVADAYFAGKIGLKFYQWYFMKKYTDKQLTAMESKLFCGKHKFKRGPRKGFTEYKGIIYRENDQFFDYRRHKRKAETITKEINNEQKETFEQGRIL